MSRMAMREIIDSLRTILLDIPSNFENSPQRDSAIANIKVAIDDLEDLLG